MVKDIDLPYLESKVVKGRIYNYFRKGRIRISLPRNKNSREFTDKYWEARTGKAKSVVKSTMAKTIELFKETPRYRKLAKSTMVNYERHFKDIIAKNGEKDIRLLRRKDIIRARDALQYTWSQANERVAVLSLLCKVAIDEEWIDTNPTKDIDKLTGGEYEPWPVEFQLAYIDYCEKHSLDLERLIFELAVGSGQRLGDLLTMLWDDFDGEFIHVVQEKTKAKLWVACPDFLIEYLNSIPREGAYIISQDLHKGYKKRSIQRRIEQVRDAIEAKKFVIHGWRYTAAIELAEAGCSDSEIQAVTGHKSLEMVRKYREQADQKRLSRQAQQKRTNMHKSRTKRETAKQIAKPTEIQNESEDK